jgi:hypothetical protein
LPKFPTSFTEVKDRVVDLSGKAYDAVFKKWMIFLLKLW